MRPLFPNRSGADPVRHAANQGEGAPEGKPSTNRFSRHSGVGGVLSDLVALARPSVMTYERRLSNVPGKTHAQKKLTRFADRIDTLPRARRWDAFNEVRNQVGNARPAAFGPIPSDGLPMRLRTKPLTALASRIGSLPEPATRGGAFKQVRDAYRDLIKFASNSTGTDRMQMQNELPELRKALESAINHLPEDARPEALESLNAIG